MSNCQSAARRPQRVGDRRRGLQLRIRDAAKRRTGTQCGAIRKLQACDPRGHKPYHHRADRPVPCQQGSQSGIQSLVVQAEIGISHPFGPKQKWEIDGYANAYFYTDNTSYPGMKTLGQQALPGFEGHISYSFTSRLWASFDTRYSFLGGTSMNGASQNNEQQNLTLGGEYFSE